MLEEYKKTDLKNYKEATNLLSGYKQIVENNGNHSFEGIERYFDEK